MKKFPFYHQLDQMDCGPTCLRMIAKYYRLNLNLQRLRNASGFSREGVSLLGIAEAAEGIGFRTIAVKVPFDKLLKNAPFPCIIHWQQQHFVVLVEVHKNAVLLADPAKGLLKMVKGDFCEYWATTQEDGRWSTSRYSLIIRTNTTFFINGFEKPSIYELSDLVQLLSGIPDVITPQQ